MISSSALRCMASYRQVDPSSPEAGGVLLGRHLLNANVVVVDEVTTPQIGDRRSRFRFSRGKQPHQHLIDDAWRRSGGEITYLGEWHTHPEPVPHPSFIDRAGWVRKVFLDRFTDPILFAIVGTEAIRLWEGERYSLHVVPVKELGSVH